MRRARSGRIVKVAQKPPTRAECLGVTALPPGKDRGKVSGEGYDPARYAGIVRLTEVFKIMPTTALPPPPPVSLLSVVWDRNACTFSLTVNALVVIAAVLAVLVFLGWRYRFMFCQIKNFEIDKAEFGLGPGKIHFKPSSESRQLAYKLWVELNTRKIGLPIDFNNDVIIEIYNSWYSFFTIARDLIKSVPAAHLHRDGTKDIIELSIEVLNAGMRPHMTQWRARFRSWHAWKLELMKEDKTLYLTPQEIQREYPDYAALVADMKDVNENLIKYKVKMLELMKA